LLASVARPPSLPDFMYMGIPNWAIAVPVAPIAIPIATAESVGQVAFRGDIASLLA